MTTVAEPYVPAPGDRVEVWGYDAVQCTAVVDSPTERDYWIITEDGTGQTYAAPTSFLTKIEEGP